MTGAWSVRLPVDPWMVASPKVDSPPSEATNQ
jgi:hypothetical protein